MKTNVYLTFNKSGTVRTTKSLPDVKSGEVTVKVAFTIADTHFRSPLAEASIDIDDDLVVRPTVETEIKDPRPCAVCGEDDDHSIHSEPWDDPEDEFHQFEPSMEEAS